MWFDRFAAQTTQSASPLLPWSRTASPAPLRRSSNLVHSVPLATAAPRRPGLPSRVTSWSGLSDGALTASPAPSTPATQTVSLRALLVPDAQGESEEESLVVLRNVLNVKPTDAWSDDQVPDISDFKDHGLDVFIPDATPLPDIPDQAATDCLEVAHHDTQRFRDLQDSVAACDQVLASVEKNLASFQADLASVATEIETLQARSTSLSTRLQHRRTVEQLLGPKLDAIVLAPPVLRKLTDGPVDEAWLKSLAKFEKTARLLDDNTAGTAADPHIVGELRPLFDKVRNRAVERVRDYVVMQIKALRSPGVNAQTIQQQNLLKHKDAFAYLSQHQSRLQEDIAKAYVNTMKWYYQSNFSIYKTALEKLKMISPDKSNLMAQEDIKRGAGQGHHDMYVLGRRYDAVMGPSHAPPVFALDDQSPTHMEEVFRAFNVALLDNASFELYFLTEFFPKTSFHGIHQRFLDIFEPTFALGRALTRQLIEQSIDGLGALLCVRLNQHSAFELQRRKNPSMDGYINGTSMLLWPRFQMIMDLHCESLRKATQATRGRPPGNALGLVNTSGQQSTAPHAVTQKFANFVHGILALSMDAGDDEPVSQSVARLRDEFVAFLVKISKGISESKKRDRFLLNNYSLIKTVINDTHGKTAEEFKEHLNSLHDALDG